MKKSKPKMMAEGGKADREKVYKQGLGDPRTGPERVAGLINRAATQGRKAPVRQYDDSPATMRKNRAASKR